MASKRGRRKSAAGFPFTDAIAFGLDCQEVMLRRFARLARGDHVAAREAQRMVSEKTATAMNAAMNAAFAFTFGGEAAATAAVANTYRKAVRANRRRLRSNC